MFQPSKENPEKKYPEGHFTGIWMGIGIALFTILGIPLSIAFDQTYFIGIAPAIGVAVGLAIGSSFEEKAKKEGRIRPKNEKEIKTKRNLVLAATALLMLGVLVFALMYFRST